MQHLRRAGVAYICGEKIQPLGAPMEAVQRYAEDLGVAAGHTVGSSLYELVPRLGGRLCVSTEDESGSVIVHGPHDFDIGLAQLTSPLRDQFTIAHELGHYFLHSLQGQRPIEVQRYGSGRLEWEANWFAAALLMPSTVFRKAHEENRSSSHLSWLFNVSTQAVEVRKKALSLE